MAKKNLVLVDTDIFIKVYRGNKIKISHLDTLKGRIAISLISVLELYQGATSKKKLFELNKQLQSYKIIHLDDNISQKALSIKKRYQLKYSILPPDCLIAATALENKFKLYTDNVKDYNFIQGIKFYQP